MNFGDLRSAVHSKNYEMQAKAWAWCKDANMRHYMASQEQWMHVRGFAPLVLWCNEILEGNLDHMAHVAYLIMAGGHSEAWMHYAMELLKDVNNGPANAADVIWWWCSASGVLWQRIQDAGHTGVEKDHVWQLLCSAACWEMMRSGKDELGHESLGLGLYDDNESVVCLFWPYAEVFDWQADMQRCKQKNWVQLNSLDWVVCVGVPGVAAGYHISFDRSRKRNKPFLEGIEAAKRVLGTWVEEDDSIWGGDQ